MQRKTNKWVRSSYVSADAYVAAVFTCTFAYAYALVKNSLESSFKNYYYYYYYYCVLNCDAYTVLLELYSYPLRIENFVIALIKIITSTLRNINRSWIQCCLVSRATKAEVLWFVGLVGSPGTIHTLTEEYVKICPGLTTRGWGNVNRNERFSVKICVVWFSIKGHDKKANKSV